MRDGGDPTGGLPAFGRERALVLGFGNRDRGDDGVAFEVLNALRRRLGAPPLSDEETGLSAGGGPVDSAFLPQLVPEWLDVAAGYGVLVFVDAHVHSAAALEYSVVTAEHAPSAFTHHMTPAMFVALLETVCGSRPEAHLISIRGHEFGFLQGLSQETSAQVAPAVERILGLIFETGRPT